jgi:hypothetical protein
MTQLAFFGFPHVIIPECTPEPQPEINRIPEKKIKRIIGDNFVVVKCLTCDQMIMVDPEFYELDAHQDKICECCNEKYQDKYMKFLKLKL